VYVGDLIFALQRKRSYTPFAGLYAVFLEWMLTTCGIYSANRQNRSTSVLEWGVIDKKPDQTVFAKERVLEKYPRMPIPNRVGRLSSVSRSSLEE